MSFKLQPKIYLTNMITNNLGLESVWKIKIIKILRLI